MNKLKGFFSSQQQAIKSNALEVLGANAGAGSMDELHSKENDTNANSAVVRLCINGKNVLIMGDATGHTTDRILNSIDDPKVLQSDLLILSHHGAENEEANHITWAAVTAPKRVAISNGFNTGYKHPTIAAVANFLATGMVVDKSSEPLVDHDFSLSDTHLLSVFNTFGPHILKLNPRVSGLNIAGFDSEA